MDKIITVQKDNGFKMEVEEKRVSQFLKEGYKIVNETKETDETNEEQSKITTRKKG